MGRGIDRIQENINTFRKRYYTNLLLKGVLLTLSIVLAYFVLATLLEYALWLNPWVKTLVILVFIITVGYCVYRFLKEPIRFWFAQKGIDDEESARLIGNYFPQIQDRLVNLIQLIRLKQDSTLAIASVEQKSTAFEPLRFDSAIDLSGNTRYLKYLAIPVGIILLLVLFNKNILTQSTHRLIHFNQEFTPQAPFLFTIQNKSLVGFFNEDFILSLSLKGNAIPDACYIYVNGQRLKMETAGIGDFQYVFEKLQESKQIRFEAAGFFSSTFDVELANRPELTQLELRLEYPRYLQRTSERLVNAGNIEIPEGTVANWTVRTAHTEKAQVRFSETDPEWLQLSDNQSFVFKRGFQNPEQYEIILENEHSKNKERISYRIDVIKDQYPQIQVNNFRDSVLYKRIVLGGIVTDDYGLSKLQLMFHVKNSNQQKIVERAVTIPIGVNQQQQSFFYNWSLDSLSLKPGEYLEYYLQVWDNDGVNGHKSTRSSVYSFFVPDKDQLVTDISKSQSQTENKIEESATRAQELSKQLNDAQQKLKGKQSLDWQDRKKLEDIIEQKKSLEKLLHELKDQNKLLEQKKDAFTEQDERIREKAQQIQKLMEELLDDETRRLIEELEKLLKENADTNQMQRLLDKLNKNSKNLEKELERILENFKQLKFDFQVDQAIKDIELIKEDQKELLEKTKSLEQEMNDNQGKSKNKEQAEKLKNEAAEKANDLAQKQEKLKEDFEKAEEKLEELREMSKELNAEENIPDQEDSQEVQDSQQDSQQDLENQKPGESKKSQQKAIQKMQQMQQQMQDMQNSMSMEIDMQNLETLRQIIHGLIKLSHDQEGIMHEFTELQSNDPRFNNLAQRQLKIKDDVKVLEDSLLSLGKRDPMMGSFVTREVTELNDRLDKAIEAYRERRRPQVSTEMQFSMTSINNLALMLDSHFDMMMEMMANARASGKKSKQKGSQPNLSQMQQQLNDRIEQLKNSGKGGRELSEELAEMAAEQERIRRALQEMERKLQEQGGQLPGGDLTEKMEDTEVDLVNKRLTEQLIERQREILTRLLETEQSMREQDMDEERKGESAKDYEKEIPRAIEEYLRLKEKEVELLKTVPPKLYPFYKKEVNEYFKRLREN
ncbi:MAG: hypothetical protein KF845_02245 [Cyclobacteriaceae bacterium]|nr:hypothetical protein [Cyclobacteriaceae bacterium]